MNKIYLVMRTIDYEGCDDVRGVFTKKEDAQRIVDEFNEESDSSIYFLCRYYVQEWELDTLDE